MKHRVAELEGAHLDTAVALAEGWTRSGNAWQRITKDATTGQILPHSPELFIFGFSTSWHLAGPIIEREGISVERYWWEHHDFSDADTDTSPQQPWQAFLDASGGWFAVGSTPLIAAMRAYVASKFGDEVELP